MSLTAEQTEKSRAEFEQWADGRCYYLDRNEKGGYYKASTALAWEIWLARQETLCVELPIGFNNDFGFVSISLAEAEIAIEAAGIAHK